ncbi:MAG: P-loop NTPase [Clostridiales bacterium]|nr:P-loop NTPase [Clostridiales bacterium]
MIQEKASQKTICAVGGGKGGTGKSFLAASLAIELGSRCGDAVIIDADFGGPNLHTLLAVRSGGRDLGGFFRNDVPRLEDILLETPHAGLKLIKGSESSLFAANLNHLKKLKLIRQIRNLPAKRVIIDLGTGSAYNTLDLFVLGRPGILIITPEPTAVENGYYFLKSCAVRILKLYGQFYKIPHLVDPLAADLENGSLTLRGSLERLVSLDARYGPMLFSALMNFRPGLVVNKITNEKDVFLGASVVDVARKYFLIELDLLATIPYDERVHLSLKKFVPFIREYPDSPVSQAIKKMAEQLTAAGQNQVERPDALSVA